MPSRRTLLSHPLEPGHEPRPDSHGPFTRGGRCCISEQRGPPAARVSGRTNGNLTMWLLSRLSLVSGLAPWLLGAGGFAALTVVLTRWPRRRWWAAPVAFLSLIHISEP